MATQRDLAELISTEFTDNILLDIVRKKSKLAHVTVCNVNISSGSKKGESYLSKVSRITIDAKGHNGFIENVQDFKVHIFVKSIPECQARVKTFRSFDFFKNEIAFYDVVWPALNAFQKSKNVSKIYDSIPLCLATFANNKDDFIVLEDVSYKGYVTLSRTDALDVDLTISILKNFAKFHALSLAYREENPCEFQKIVKHVQETYFHEGLRVWYKGIMKKYQCAAKDAVEKELPASYLEKMEAVLSEDVYGKTCKLLQEDSKFRAINHGDCWAPNILIKGIGNEMDIMLIDFQIMRYTSVAIDILFFIYTCVDPEVRNKHWNLLLTSYYETLTDTLNKLGSTLNISFDLFKAEIKKYGYCAFVICMDALIMALLDDEDVIDVDAIEGDEEIPIHEVWVVKPIKNAEKRKRVADFVKHAVDNGFV